MGLPPSVKNSTKTKTIMINMEPCIRKLNKNGYAQVYLRITKDRVISYMQIPFTVSKSQTSGLKITDFRVISNIVPKVNEYYTKLNSVNTESWSSKEIVEYLKNDKQEVPFVEFFKEFTNKMILDDRETSVPNYFSALNSLLGHLGRDSVNFSDLTSNVINEWIDSLKSSKRKKNLYPTCIKTVFKAGMRKYNIYEKDIIKIKYNPFEMVKIPANDKVKKRVVDRVIIKQVFRCDTSKAKMYAKTPMAKDVAMLIFFLAGINVADLYYMDKSCRIGNKLSYIRHKTSKKLREDGRMIITIPKQILPLFDKYEGKKNLFSFADQYKSEKNFLKCVDMGLKEVADILGIETLSTYYFRVSYASIAQNKLDASTDLVGFALAHAPKKEDRVTQGYIERDFSRVDKLNEKVIKYVMSNERKIKCRFKFISSKK